MVETGLSYTKGYATTLGNYMGRKPSGICRLYVCDFVCYIFASSSTSQCSSNFHSFTRSVWGSTLIITIIGFPWAISQWAPFSLVSYHYYYGPSYPYQHLFFYSSQKPFLQNQQLTPKRALSIWLILVHGLITNRDQQQVIKTSMMFSL